MNSMRDENHPLRRATDDVLKKPLVGGVGVGLDQRENVQGRRRTNWVGRYQIGTAEMLRIHADTIKTITVAVLVGVLLSLIAFVLTPAAYRATGTILVDELPFVQTGKAGDAETERQLVQTLILSIANREMKLAVEKELGIPPGRIAFAGLDRRVTPSAGGPVANVQVAAIRNSRLGSITADSRSPEFAAAVVNAVLNQLDLYNRVGGSLKAIQTLAALSKSQADNMILQLSDVSAQRIKLEQEKDQLEDYLKKGLPLENYPVFAQDATLGNLKTQLFLVESEYKALASTSTRGARLQGKASELRSLRGQLDSYAKKLAESLRSEYAIRLSQEKDLQVSKQKAAEKLDAYSEASAHIAQSFGNPEQMRLIAEKSPVDGIKQGDANMIVVVNRASSPVKPYTPLLLVYLFLGAGIGGAIGFAYAFMTSLSDNALVSPAQIETRLGIPCLAVFPISEKMIPPTLSPTPGTQRGDSSSGEDSGGTSEAGVFDVGALIDRLFAVTNEYQFSVFGFTPVLTHQRSSPMIARLAQLMANEGRRVVVIDLHFKDPRIAPTLGVTIEKCLGDWLLSEQPMESAMNLVPVTGPGKLALIAPSSPKAKLIEVIGRRPISAWLNSHSTDWDCVLIDAPCLIPDRLLEMVLPLYSNLILTAEYHRTKMSELTLACSISRARQWRVMGVVITDSPRIAS